MVRGVDGVASVGRRTQAQAVQHGLLRIERARAARVFRLVGSRVRGADGVQVPHRLRLRVDDVKTAAGRHAAGHHPARVRDDDEVFGVLDAADEIQST